MKIITTGSIFLLNYELPFSKLPGKFESEISASHGGRYED
jgi:hypothetical protein